MMKSDYLLNPLSKQLMGEVRHQFYVCNLLINQKWNKSAEKIKRYIDFSGGGGCNIFFVSLVLFLFF